MSLMDEIFPVGCAAETGQPIKCSDNFRGLIKQHHCRSASRWQRSPKSRSASTTSHINILIIINLLTVHILYCRLFYGNSVFIILNTEEMFMLSALFQYFFCYYWSYLSSRVISAADYWQKSSCSVTSVYWMNFSCWCWWGPTHQQITSVWSLSFSWIRRLIYS